MKNRNIEHKDDWATPKVLYDELDKEFNFDFDPCPYMHDMSWDGLEVEWENTFKINLIWNSNVQNANTIKQHSNFIPEMIEQENSHHDVKSVVEVSQEYEKEKNENPYLLNTIQVQDSSHVQNVKAVKYYQNISNVQRVEKDMHLNVNNVKDMKKNPQLNKKRKLKESLKTQQKEILESKIEEKEKPYYETTLLNVQDVTLLNHLMKLISILTYVKSINLIHTVKTAKEKSPGYIWQGKEIILLQEIKSELRRLNTENLKKVENLTEKEVLSVITYIDRLFSNGAKKNGKSVNYILKTDVPIVKEKSFLLKIIIYLYQILIAQEQSEQILFQHVCTATHQKEISILINGVGQKLFNQYKDIFPVVANINNKNTSVFCNPPYSRTLKEAFVKKALEESRKGKTCVLLLPVSTSTKLFHDVIKPNAKEIRFLRGRVKFKGVNTKGEEVSNSCGMHDSMLVIFNGKN